MSLLREVPISVQKEEPEEFAFANGGGGGVYSTSEQLILVLLLSGSSPFVISSNFLFTMKKNNWYEVGFIYYLILK